MFLEKEGKLIYSYDGETVCIVDGRFVLDAPKNAVLQITYIGYVSQEVKVSGNKELNVVLKEDTETLEIGRAHV